MPGEGRGCFRQVKGHGEVRGTATPQDNSQTPPGPSAGEFHIPQGWEGTYRALVGLRPLLALQTCRELLVCAVGDLLHQLQPLLHLWTEQWVGLLGEGRSEVGSRGLDNQGTGLTQVSAETTSNAGEKEGNHRRRDSLLTMQSNAFKCLLRNLTRTGVHKARGYHKGCVSKQTR